MEQVTEHAVQIGNRTLNYYLLRPDPRVQHESPLVLLTFAMDWQASLLEEPYCIPANQFVQQGHYAVSFDLPCHGARVNDYGYGIDGFCKAIQEGSDPFALFLEDAASVIDQCVEQGIAFPGQIVVSGTSRGAYFALRLLAADSRVARAGGFGPVTDWNELAEFAPIRYTEAVNRLRLSQFIEGMTNKPVFLAIGHHDTRVSTLSCCRFVVQLAERNLYLGNADSSSLPDFYCTDDEGHTMGNSWYEKGAAFLLAPANQ